MFRNRSANVHQFAMIPSAQIPRSSFNMESTHKTAIDAGLLIPVYVDEVLPGDTFNMHATFFGRLATPIFPIMDNLYIDSFWFFVPNRLVYDNWEKLQGAQDNPGDSTSYATPAMVSPAGGYAVGSLQDYMGLPTVGQMAADGLVGHSTLPLRAYNLIWNEWFRDENLQDALTVPKGDAGDNLSYYSLRRRGKRADYFTGCLPWTQKGPAVGLPLGESAPVITTNAQIDTNGLPPMMVKTTTNSAPGALNALTINNANQLMNGSATGLANGALHLMPSNLIADLSEATAATINSIRMAFQMQRLLERDARGGTRYVEALKARFGVSPPDFRLQRPEYLGGNSKRISINPVTQTSGATPDSETPQGNLAAFGTMVSNNGFRQSFTEHGHVMCLIAVRADLTYQQGIRKMWRRATRFDYYEPVFAMLGEQAVHNREIYCSGHDSDTGGIDDLVFGYQERWAEYRYRPNMITGLMRSTSAQTIDNWHLAQRFSTTPTLNHDFIEDNPPLSRVLAVGPEANGQQILLDCFFQCRAARPMPIYSVPGMIDHL